MRYHHDVRTTLTLDHDVKAKLDREIRESGKSFEEAVNYYLRLGLNVAARTEPAKKFAVRARRWGCLLGSPTTMWRNLSSSWKARSTNDRITEPWRPAARAWGSGRTLRSAISEAAQSAVSRAFAPTGRGVCRSRPPAGSAPAARIMVCYRTGPPPSHGWRPPPRRVPPS